MVYNQYDIGRRGCALMLSLPKANWDGQADRQAGGQAQVSIGMHAHPKIYQAINYKLYASRIVAFSYLPICYVIYVS
jgi:hypothetical protein